MTDIKDVISKGGGEAVGKGRKA